MHKLLARRTWQDEIIAVRFHDELRALLPAALLIDRARDFLQIAEIARQKRRLALQTPPLRHAQDGQGEGGNKRQNAADREHFQQREAFLFHRQSPP